MASTTPADFGRSPWRSRRCPPPRCSWTGKSPRLMSTLLSRRAFLHPDPHALVTPPIYIAFDCVHASGRDLRDHPLGARREVVERLIGDQHLLFPACCLPAHGLAAWAEVQRRGYEGLVAKDETSAYRSGRTRSWLKVKLREEDGAGRYGCGTFSKDITIGSAPNVWRPWQSRDPHRRFFSASA